MRKTISGKLRTCTISHRAKYHPEVTRTPNMPLLVLVDIFMWGGLQWLTVIETFSKLAKAYSLPSKTSDAVWESMFAWISHYGVPHKITSDGGMEFKNARTTTEFRPWRTVVFPFAREPSRTGGHRATSLYPWWACSPILAPQGIRSKNSTASSDNCVK